MLLLSPRFTRLRHQRRLLHWDAIARARFVQTGEQVKTQVMREAVLKKFLTHIDIQATLISTDNQLIVENSPTDYYWGCGGDQSGYNHLGKILMSVRQEICQQSGASLGEREKYPRGLA